MNDDATRGTPPEPLLRIEDLTMRFGGLTAINKLSFAVQPGTIHGLIGPNGAGKTTTFNVISGYYAPTEGRVLYKGQNIAGLSMPQVAAKGLVRTFQHSTLFQEFTLLQNVLVGRYMHQRPTLLGAVLGSEAKAIRDNDAKAREALSFFGLLEREGEQDLGAQAWWSFGGLFLVDSPEQRRLGIRDPLELARQDRLGSAAVEEPDGSDDHWPRRWAEA